MGEAINSFPEIPLSFSVPIKKLGHLDHGWFPFRDSILPSNTNGPPLDRSLSGSVPITIFLHLFPL